MGCTNSGSDRVPGRGAAADVELTCPQSDVATAGQFVDSIGVATHLSYRRTAYGNSELVQKLLTDLGVHHIRDGWRADDADLARRAMALAEQGIKITFVHDPREGGTPEQQHQRVRDNLLGALEAAESLNEPDLQGGDWAKESIQWTRRLSQAYRGDARTDDVPLLAPSLSQVNDADAHEALSDLQGVVDFGNTHDYPGKDLVMNDEILDTVQRSQEKIVGTKPVMATETGYSDGEVDAPYPVVSQEEIAQLLPGLFFEHFRRGIARTFAYELLDEGPGQSFEMNFGLVEHDGRPKPSFVSLRNLIDILSAPEKACDQPPLRLDIAPTGSGLRRLVLSAGQDEYFLALWRQRRPDSAVGQEAAVRVRIANPVEQVRWYRPSVQPAPMRTGTGGDLEVPVGNAVTILRLSGVGAAPSPAPTTTAAGAKGKPAAR